MKAIDLLSKKKLQKKFYSSSAVKLSKKLLNQIFVMNKDGQLLAGRITEVEAYIGRVDQAAHSYKGKTKRTEVMFRHGGYLYVYFIYGAHFCANIVAGKADEGEACLIRAMEPLIGIEFFTKNRFNKSKLTETEFVNLLNGPGKICQAFGIRKAQNGIDLTDDEIYLLKDRFLNEKEIGISERIGISKSKELPWRFFIKGNKYLSRKEKCLHKKSQYENHKNSSGLSSNENL